MIFYKTTDPPSSIGQANHLILFSMSMNLAILRLRKQFLPGAKRILPNFLDSTYRIWIFYKNT